MLKVLILIFASFLISCATGTNSDSAGLTEDQYLEVIEPVTKTVKKYNGLQNTMDLAVTFNSSKLLEAQISRQAQVLSWTQLQTSEQKAKRFEKVATETEVFISFFTPERKNDDLTRNQSLWKVYLLSDGRKFEGKAERLKGLPAEIAMIYPEYNRFATPYIIRFPVALGTVENKSLKVTVTGPLGAAEVTFE